MVKEETPAKARKAYAINKVTIYPNFSIEKDTLSLKDTSVVKYKDLTIIDSADTFDPRVFDRRVYLKKRRLIQQK